jgi:hypothetical protein
VQKLSILALIAIVSAQGCGGSEAVDTSRPVVTLTVYAGQNQSALVGTEVPTHPTVRVAGEFGEPLAVVVKFEVTSGGGTILADLVPTGSNGLAKAERWVLGAPGRNTLTATIPTEPSLSVIFTATGLQAR